MSRVALCGAPTDGPCCDRPIIPCCTRGRAATISIIVGSILLTLGAAMLLGLYGPSQFGFVQDLNHLVNFVASHLYSPPFTLTVFAIGFGAGFFLVGIDGLSKQICCAEPNRKK